jgi:hypothetical protein
MLLDELKKLEALGMSFTVAYPPGGCVDLHVEDVARWARDQDVYWADVFNVSLGHYRAWRQLTRGSQCSGTRRDGRPCQQTLWEYPSEPGHYRPGTSDRCPDHQELGEGRVVRRGRSR